PVPASRRICRQDSARSETGRYPSRAADQVRADYPPDDGEGARPHHSADAARPRRRGDRMKRRAFITLLGGATVTWPLAARAQQPERMRRIGVLLPAAADDAEFQAPGGAFQQGLALLGWTIGRNVRIDSRWATANVAEIRRHAAELVALPPPRHHSGPW